MTLKTNCRYDRDCSRGQICNEWQYCESVAEGTRCDIYSNCQPPSSWSSKGTKLKCCYGTGKCAHESECRNSRRLYCSASSDCHADEYCDMEKGKCVTRVGSGNSCTDDEQVKHNYKCYQGKVVSPCRTDFDCGYGEECSVSSYHLNSYCFKKISSSSSSSYDYSTSKSSSSSSSSSSYYYETRTSNLSWILPMSISLAVLVIIIIAVFVRRRRAAKMAALAGMTSAPKIIQMPPPSPKFHSSQPQSPAPSFHAYHPQQPYQAPSSPFPGYASSAQPHSMPSASVPHMPPQQDGSHDLPPYQPQ